jgi:hypothetical protein
MMRITIRLHNKIATQPAAAADLAKAQREND